MQDIERSAPDEGGDDQDVSEVSVASDLRAAPRSWSDEEKAWLVRESREPGVTVADVAQRYGVPPRRLSAWRKLARKGELTVEPTPESEGPFAALEVEPVPGPAHIGSVSIEVRGVTVRLDGDVSTARITAIASALRGIR